MAVENRGSVHLVGSFPLTSAREVFEAAGPVLRGFAARLPGRGATGLDQFLE